MKDEYGEALTVNSSNSAGISIKAQEPGASSSSSSSSSAFTGRQSSGSGRDVNVAGSGGANSGGINSGGVGSSSGAVNSSSGVGGGAGGGGGESTMEKQLGLLGIRSCASILRRVRSSVPDGTAVKVHKVL